MSRPFLAAAIGAPDTTAALRALERAAQVADLAEVRLDYMRECDLPRLIRARPLPLIITCRPRREGGRYEGDEAARLQILRQAIDLGVEHVDVEWDALTWLEDVERGRTRVIISRHDFATMPADFVAQSATLAASGADIVKVVATAHDLCDLIPVFQVLRTAARPTIAIAMGEAGMASRILALRCRACYLTFGALEDGGTAPGQIALADLRTIYRASTIGPATRAFGHVALRLPARDVLAAGNDALRAVGLDAVWVPLVAGQLDPARLDTLAALDLAGCTVDEPFMAQAARLPLELTSTARRSGRVDILVRTGDGWLGEYLGRGPVAGVAWMGGEVTSNE